MNKRKILLYGAGGHAKVVIDAIHKGLEYEVIGIVDKQLQEDIFLAGFPIIAEIDVFNVLRQVDGCIVAIGDNWTRSCVVASIKKIRSDVDFVSVVHPFTSIGQNVKIGVGTVILAGAIINSGTSIGDHCIVNTRASLDHDNVLGDFASVAPNVATGGNVVIGNFSALSIGATIIHNIHIGEHTVIGAGALVTKDIPQKIVAFGIPAKKIRERIEGDGYL